MGVAAHVSPPRIRVMVAMLTIARVISWARPRALATLIPQNSSSLDIFDREEASTLTIYPACDQFAL